MHGSHTYVIGVYKTEYIPILPFSVKRMSMGISTGRTNSSRLFMRTSSMKFGDWSRPFIAPLPWIVNNMFTDIVLFSTIL